MTVHGYRRDVSDLVRQGRLPGPPRPPGRHRGASGRPYPLLLALMSVVVPGSGHLYAGYRRTGAAIIVLFAMVVALVCGALLVVPWEHLLAATVRPRWLEVTMLACGLLALSLVLVVLDAYRLGRPRRLPMGQRVAGRVIVLGLCAALAAPLGMLASYANVQRGLISDVFLDKPEPPQTGFAAGGWTGARRLNVLLVGGDGAAGRPGIRADSVTVASLDTETGDTVLFSLPRNLENAPFPEGTPAAAQLPGGYPDFFFGVYQFGQENPDLFPGSSDPGASAVASSASAVLGIPVHYYVRVNMPGFRKMIDTLGGIRLRVTERLPIGGGESMTTGEKLPVVGYIEPGLKTLDGFHALWYARSRSASDDYDRMARQRCVLGALARQANPVTVLRHFRELADATKQAVATNIPQDVLPDLVYVASEVKQAKITSLQFVPPLIDTGSPDFALIRSKVEQAIAVAEKAGQGGSGGDGSGTESASGSGPGSGSGDASDPGSRSAGGAGANVDKQCRYE